MRNVFINLEGQAYNRRYRYNDLRWGSIMLHLLVWSGSNCSCNCLDVDIERGLQVLCVVFGKHRSQNIQQSHPTPSWKCWLKKKHPGSFSLRQINISKTNKTKMPSATPTTTIPKFVPCPPTKEKLEYVDLVNLDLSKFDDPVTRKELAKELLDGVTKRKLHISNSHLGLQSAKLTFWQMVFSQSPTMEFHKLCTSHKSALLMQ